MVASKLQEEDLVLILELFPKLKYIEIIIFVIIKYIKYKKY